MEKYTQNYKGIVLQNDDPDKMGRVKVWVPQISMTLYDKWNNDRDNDKSFTGLGANLNSALTPEILQRLKNALPWASTKQPFIGMSAPGLYNNDVNYTEQGNDSDQSTQQVVTNKTANPAQSKNNGSKGLAEALKPTVKAPPNAQTASNNYNAPLQAGTTASAAPSFIKNATTNTVTPNPTTSAPTTSATDDNIDSVVVTFTPNNRNVNNLHRRFTVGFETDTGLEGTVAATAGQSTTIFRDNAGEVVKFSPPITYAIAPPPPAATPRNPNDDLTITFVPNERNSLGNNINRRFTAKATSISYDGSVITLEADARGVGSQKTFSITKEQIDEIGIRYADPNAQINMGSTRLGGLAPVIKEYTSPSGSASPKTSNKSVITPPSPISSPSYNKGGGNELFRLAYSNLLPIGTMTNTLVNGPNPDTKTGMSYGTDMDASIDPQQRTKPGITTKPDAKPPIRSSTQSNKVKGAISIPAVGAHVSVYFDNGDPLYPILDGWFPTQEDFLGAHDVAV